MQVLPAVVLDAFGLTIDPARFPDPELSPGPEMPARIAAALWHEMDKIALAPQAVARRPGQRMGCLVRAVLALSRSGQKVAAVHLAVASGARRRQIAVTAAREMLECRALASAAGYMAALEPDPDLDPAVRRNFLDLRMHNRLGLKPRDHDVFVPGGIPATLEAAFAAMPAPGIEWTSPLMLEAILRLRGLTGAAAEDFARRIDWGRAVQDYLTFLKFYAARDGGAAADAGGSDNAAIHALAGRIRDLVVLPEPGPLALAASRQAGRSLVLTSAHTGLSVVAPMLIQPTGLPAFGISALAATDLDDPDIKTLGVGGDVHNDFLRAIKLLRKEPHVIQIMPDGGFGGDPVILPFLGGEVRLGSGAAMLAWQTRAAVFFFSTRWQDGRLHVYLREGPVAEKDGDRAAFEAEFYDFYLGCLEKIVMGAPEDMSPGSGFWPGLITEEVRAAFRARAKP